MNFSGVIKVTRVDDVVPTKNSQLVRFTAEDFSSDNDVFVEYIAWGGLADKVSKFSSGDVLEVSGYIKSREWKERCYTDAVVTDVKLAQGQREEASDDSLPF